MLFWKKSSFNNTLEKPDEWERKNSNLNDSYAMFLNFVEKFPLLEEWKRSMTNKFVIE